MTPPLLLDTCAVIWITENAPLSDESVAALDGAADAGEPVYVSPITAWEIGLLASRGRLQLALPPSAWFRRVLERPGVRLAELSPEILVESSFLLGAPPRDPADRIMIATARALGMRLVTRDSLLIDYARQGHLRLVAC